MLENNENNNINYNEEQNNININYLANRINELENEAFKTIFDIIKLNNEKYNKTNKYYLVDLNNVSNKTLIDLNNYIKYMDDLDYKNN